MDGGQSAVIGGALFHLAIHISGFSPMVCPAASRRKSKCLDEKPMNSRRFNPLLPLLGGVINAHTAMA
jgi:hypothetical protein